MYKKLCITIGVVAFVALLALNFRISSVEAAEIPGKLFVEDSLKEASLADIKNNSTPLTLNQVRSTDMLTSTDDEKWYKFTITKPGYFRMVMGPADSADTDLIKSGWEYSLYKSDDVTNTVKNYTGIKSVTTSSYFVMELGDYYIRVTNYNIYSAPINQNYQIKIDYSENSAFVMENNDSSANASQIDVNKTYYSTSYHTEDVDWYKFTIPSDGLFMLDFGMSDYADRDYIKSGWDATLFDGDYNTIRSYSGITGKLTGDTSSELLPYKAGDYYLKVNNRNIYSAPVDQPYYFKIIFKSPANWEAEYNNSNTTATVLSQNQNMEGLLYCADDVDWYKLTLTKTSDVVVTFALSPTVNADSILYGWTISLYDTNKNEVKNVSGAKESFSFDKMTCTAGTYYIKVKAGSIYSAPIGCRYILKANCTAAASSLDSSLSSSQDVKKGTDITIGREKDTYTVTSVGATATVSYKKRALTAASMTIPATIKDSTGKTYKVTAIASNAFKNNKKIKKIVIGTNVETISKSAFDGCKNIKLITIKSTKIKKIEKNAFKGLGKKAVIKVPKKQKKSYTRMLKKAGFKGTIK